VYIFRQTLATNPFPTRTFCIFKSPCMTGCGRTECRYSIPRTTPWARNNFFCQSSWNTIHRFDHNCCWNYKQNLYRPKITVINYHLVLALFLSYSLLHEHTARGKILTSDPIYASKFSNSNVTADAWNVVLLGDHRCKPINSDFAPLKLLSFYMPMSRDSFIGA